MILLRHPFTAVIAGPSGAGKSQLTISLLNNAKECVDGNFQKIIWCYAERNSIDAFLRQLSNEQKQKITFV